MPEEEIKRLPEGWRVLQSRLLEVPRLEAERHLIFIEREP